ncbi:hypothetical protein FAES_0807 [Fibrella aestuarina BUZ 2]|uniref:Capsule assembly Wzi family protein n=1 Tax=Fibrella aestuarina BUZ 2 TaxID=1166018 RepID=I0K3W5_9BACT|nr:hypothetical protein FAES_0807 [Fibrella aestuarina BUZ 2]
MQKFTLWFATLCLPHLAAAQAIPDTTSRGTRSFVEVGGLAASASQTPFWLRTRQYGLVPLNNPAGIVRAGTTFFKGDPTDPRRVHLKVGIEGALISSATTPAEPNAVRILLPEAYASLRLGQFELYGGRRREVFGLMDTLLTSGSYSWSGNALPIPKIQLGTRGFAPLGFTNGIVAINAFYAHGWFGKADSVQGSYLHQKALYGRVSLFKRRVNLYAGVVHNAQWAGRRNVGTLSVNGQLPNTFKDYLRVITASETPIADSTSYVEIDRLNRVGNHLGSIDFAVEILGDRSNWFLYYQHPYEDKSGVAFQNMPDGLYGVRWRNAGAVTGGFRFQQVTAEVLSTMNQSGFTTDQNGLFAGADDYFNNYQYSDGWAYRRHIIGTPFITLREDTRPDLRDLRSAYGRLTVSSNRAQVIHIGLLGGWPSGAQVRALFSFSQHFGRPILRDPRVPLAQFSGMAEASVPLRWLGGSELAATVSLDQGQWLTNNFGGWIRLRKIFARPQ